MKTLVKKIRKFFTPTYKAERLRFVLNNDLNERDWCNDYSQENFLIHVGAARLIGYGRDAYCWTNLGLDLGLPSNDTSQPYVQNKLLFEIEKDLGVQHLPQESESRHWYVPNIEGIAKKLGLDALRPVEQLPIPFIIYAFISFKLKQL